MYNKILLIMERLPLARYTNYKHYVLEPCHFYNTYDFENKPISISATSADYLPINGGLPGDSKVIYNVNDGKTDMYIAYLPYHVRGSRSLPINPFIIGALCNVQNKYRKGYIKKIFEMLNGVIEVNVLSSLILSYLKN